MCQPTPVDSNSLSDEQVVALALDDRHSLGLLYERYADRLYWYASVRTGSATAADDIVGDTMIAVLENLESFDGARGSFASWLFAIAHRKVMDHHRYHQRLRRFISRSGRRLELDAEEDALERVLRQERTGELYSALCQLRPEDQNLIALRYSAELPSTEVAAVIGTTPATARKRLSRAMDRLHEHLDRERQDE